MLMNFHLQELPKVVDKKFTLNEMTYTIYYNKFINSQHLCASKRGFKPSLTLTHLTWRLYFSTQAEYF